MERDRALTRKLFGFIVAGVLFAGCAAYRPASTYRPPPPRAARYPNGVVGVASWYGPGFDGHRTASGAIYNQDDLTAATLLFPLGSRVMVTNLGNRRSVEVLINDRGPYKKGRIIDLSHQSARVLGLLRPGTARVRLRLIGAETVVTPIRYFVQVGSFSRPGHAERLLRKIRHYYSDARIYETAIHRHRYYRVRMGGFSTREEALARARKASGLGLPMVIVSK
ncbi:MAG: septal ring lytic transglycosylase RlpA family protein [Candidatus Binataceae bacterium]